MRLRKLALLLCLAAPLSLTAPARAAETPTEHAANQAAAQELAAAPLHGNLPDYSLPPDTLAKAQHISAIRVYTHFGGILWGVLQAVLLLWLGAIAWMRDKAVQVGAQRHHQLAIVPFVYLLFTCLIDVVPAAVVAWLSADHRLSPRVGLELQLGLFLVSGAILWRWRKKVRASAYRWVEGYTFLLLFLLAGFLLDLPLDIYSHNLSLHYGLSVQGWASWFADKGKSFLISSLAGGMLVLLLFFIIRKFPRRWWLVFWAISVPITLAGVFATPYVIDPLFNKFEPLQQTNPALVAQLEKVVARGHMNIPPERMFLMKASAKVTTMNAYVTGFGASKRVVVWDTSLQKGTPDEILFIFGHESGHYVLNHIVTGIFFTEIVLLVLFYLGFRFIQWALARFGPRWRIPSQNDWGALAVLILAFSIFGAILEPVQSTFSRSLEHAADVYGQEAIHGIVPDPQKAAAGAFQVLGENSLDEPNTPPFIEFWTDGHPSTGRRAAFAAHYDPWAPGADPKYFKK